MTVNILTESEEIVFLKHCSTLINCVKITIQSGHGSKLTTLVENEMVLNHSEWHPILYHKDFISSFIFIMLAEVLWKLCETQQYLVLKYYLILLGSKRKAGQLGKTGTKYE